MLSETAKTILIVSIAVLVLIGCFALVIYLLSDYKNSNDSMNPSENYSYNYVIEVIDGDTFVIGNETIRLLCVDTPEEGDSGYEEAKDFLTDRLNSDVSNIMLEGNKTDSYGRSLRWVYIGDDLINKEIIDFGFGTLFEYEDENCNLVSS